MKLRLNRGPRLVPACNSGLIHGNYWILHQPFFSIAVFSFFSYCSPSSVSPTLSAHVPLTSHQLFSVLAFGSHLHPFLITSLYHFTSSCPTVLSPLIMGFLLSPLFSALASSSSLQSLCSDGQGLNATLEMIIPLCSCSGVFFFCCIFIISSNTLLILFFSLCLCLAHFFALCCSHCLILSYGHPHARGMLKPCYSQGIGREKEQERARDTMNNRKTFLWCVSPLVLLLSSFVWWRECANARTSVPAGQMCTYLQYM